MADDLLPCGSDPADFDGKHPLERRLGGYSEWLTYCIDGRFALENTSHAFVEAMRDDMKLAASRLSPPQPEAVRGRFGLSPLEIERIRSGLIEGLEKAYWSGSEIDTDFDATKAADKILASLEPTNPLKGRNDD